MRTYEKSFIDRYKNNPKALADYARIVEFENDDSEEFKVNFLLLKLERIANTLDAMAKDDE